MLFLNISSDNTWISNGQKDEYIQRHNLERLFPQAMKRFFDNGFDNKIFVLNGPGSFTSLRICTLNINMLNFVNKDKFDIFDISKPAFYKKLYIDGFLPRFGIIFIGQSKNFWLYDFQNDDFKQITTGQIQEIKEEYFIDNISGDAKKLFDEKRIINFSFQNNVLKISFDDKEKNLELPKYFGLDAQKTIAPNYMIKPNIS